ncbi:HNH endonuclease [Rugamonas aquatica]|uniref:HNH endonuclease n=1 Tax=Rugamonas aquatica TaxID=2743357 RepID=UPI001583FC6D|nr:HNH endonuclease [Rugamonas aquatica]
MCDATTGLQVHHIKPRSLGGSNDPDNLITLCEQHHEAVHDLDDEYNHANLVKIGQAKAKAKGVVFGNPTNLKEAQAKGTATLKAKSQAFTKRFQPSIQRLRKAGMTFREIAEHFNLMGVPTALNGLWHAKTVHTLAHRPV